MAYVRVNDIDHYYEWVGTDTPRDPGSTKPVMVFVHGWAGSARYWQSTAVALSDRYDCLLYDMRGFGRSLITADQQDAAAARGYELDTYADDLEEMLTTLGLPKVSINAHSMGASVAVYFLNQYPQLVEQAILTCNGIFDTTRRPLRRSIRLAATWLPFGPSGWEKFP